MGVERASGLTVGAYRGGRQNNATAVGERSPLRRRPRGRADGGLGCSIPALSLL